jgi:hydrogenase maturation factor
MVGGATMIGVGDIDKYVTPKLARAGDKIIITKGPAIEAAGILAYQAEQALIDRLGRQVVEQAKRHFFEMTVIKDALIAGPHAHAMHDATEGGLLNGIYEIAAASDTGVNIYADRIPLPEDIAAVCAYFNIDPLISISEGTLLITAAPEKSGVIIADLKDQGIAAWDIGEITSGPKIVIHSNNRSEELKPVAVDPFWAAYFSTLEENHD